MKFTRQRLKTICVYTTTKYDLNGTKSLRLLLSFTRQRPKTIPYRPSPEPHTYPGTVLFGVWALVFERLPQPCDRRIDIIGKCAYHEVIAAQKKKPQRAQGQRVAVVPTSRRQECPQPPWSRVRSPHAGRGSQGGCAYSPAGCCAASAAWPACSLHGDNYGLPYCKPTFIAHLPSHTHIQAQYCLGFGRLYLNACHNRVTGG